MRTSIFYYTGTGNSLWVARQAAEALGDADVRSMSAWLQARPAIDSTSIGLVFPVYIWGVPAPVMRFVAALPDLRDRYFFAFATNGGQVSNTLVQLQKLMAGRGLRLSAGFDIPMPSNYIPWGGPGPRQVQEQRFQAAQAKIAANAAGLKLRRDTPIEKGPLWQRIVFSAIYKACFGYVPRMDAKFFADEKCTNCGVCAKVCPARNITIESGKPLWHHTCEQCFACLQWCPTEAIQYGKRTVRFERYHHPAVALKDVLKTRP
ncbi:MAG TPA: EFR1 family ferrodoxin [Deltaproteobacteria bacterium]|nr:EFR1 family ferrodoxin [Deltaproteobacteria bacterium]